MDSKTFTTQIAKRLGCGYQEAAELIESLAAVMTDRLGDLDAVAIPGFGNFTSKKHAERISVDTASGKRMLLPPRIKVDFTAGAMLKKQVENSSEGVSKE